MGVLAVSAVGFKRSRVEDFSLFRWRKYPRFGAAETCVLVIYIALLAITVPYHEPWSDEAQAWLIARDNSFWQIFHTRLHYEGSPPLWHFILRALHLLHVPWSAIGWCGAAFACAGVVVWLRWSPLPPLLRWLFPFTFFMQYQYAVVTRSYVLFPLLLFSLCILYRSSKVRPIAWAILSGLLANLCMQGMVVSTVITLLYCLELRRHWQLHRDRTFASKRSLYASAIVAVVFWSISISSAMPAPDVTFAVGNRVSTGLTHRVLVSLVGETPTNHPSAIVPDYTPDQWAAIWAAAVPPEPRWQKTPGRWLAWQMRSPLSRRIFGDRLNGILYAVVETLSEMLWPIATLNLLGLVFIASLFLWAIRRGALRYFVPALVLLIVGEFLWIADHHSGMLFITSIAGIWLAGTQPQKTTDESSRSDLTLLVSTAIIFLLQIGWSATAIYHDREASYDPSSETAHFLQAKPASTTMVAFRFWATGVQPYFNRNPFPNLPSSWWQWCSNIMVDATHRETIARHPDIVLYTYEDPQRDSMRNQIIPLTELTGYEPIDPILTDLKNQNYHETHRFCGRRFDRWSAAYEVCDVIFEPSAKGVAK